MGAFWTLSIQNRGTITVTKFRRSLQEDEVYHLFKAAMTDNVKQEALLRMAENNFQGSGIRDCCIIAALKGDIRPCDVLAKMLGEGYQSGLRGSGSFGYQL